MKLLVADDDPIARQLLRCTPTQWGYDFVVCADGDQAWRELSGPDAPAVAILDRMMPGMDGLELCRRPRNTPVGPSMYLILLTPNNRPDQLAAGLEAGADDHIPKPFRHEELRARIRAGTRIVNLHRAHQERVRQLEGALSNVKQLSTTVRTRARTEAQQGRTRPLLLPPADPPPFCAAGGGQTALTRPIVSVNR